ncbi:MAG: dUTP diphosphatase [Ruminococcus sp.]|uniref:dUTP diphosphatase n=1 Tax=Ruminococcus sp. TaxID=41978 RepID=UPI003F0E46F6
MAKRQEPLKVIRVVLCGGWMPKQSVEYSAGYDLYVPFDTVIERGRQVVKIGVKMGLPKGIDGHVRPRSGFSIKGMEGWTIPRFPWQNPKKGRFDADVVEGTIDCGYLDEIGVIINNHDKPFVIEGGTRIAQIVFNKHELPQLLETDELKGYDRGGGLGHTGTK